MYTIADIPEAYVRLGTSLDAHALREGTDVYFDCLVVAHPQVFRIEWRHNVSAIKLLIFLRIIVVLGFFNILMKIPFFLQNHLLLHNISQGIIISNHSLVLQGVTRSTAGNYSCVGFNAEGEGISEPFVLNILCESFIIKRKVKTNFILTLHKFLFHFFRCSHLCPKSTKNLWGSQTGRSPNKMHC